MQRRWISSMRTRLMASLLGLLGAASHPVAAADAWPLVPRDLPKLELVMQLVVTCASPEGTGGSSRSKDGERKEIWPIIGGRFEGKGIRGTVIPGGGDFPVVRPDGVEVIDALYRLRTDDGVQIIIHNEGLTYPTDTPGWGRYRLAPTFIAPVGKYDWLNRGIFVSTLTEVPKGMELAKGPSENDRLIQVYRVN